MHMVAYRYEPYTAVSSSFCQPVLCWAGSGSLCLAGSSAAWSLRIVFAYYVHAWPVLCAMRLPHARMHIHLYS